MSSYTSRALISARLLAGGLKSYLPVPKRYTGTGGTISARYCYAVWLRHLMTLADAVPGLRPRVVAELGPGDSIGLGLAALLSGMDRYVALDVLSHASLDANLRILEELVALYREHAPIPDSGEFPNLYPRVDDYAFPRAVLARLGLELRTDETQVAALRQALRAAFEGPGRPSNAVSKIQYLCPWTTAELPPGSVDLVISQAVLQDMDHWTTVSVLRTAFEAMAQWLGTGGVMSHQVDLAVPDGDRWNQHWTYGESVWTMIRGKRPYFFNRVPASEYLRLCDEYGFDVVAARRVLDQDGVERERLTPRFKALPADDLRTRSLHFIAVKRAAP